MNRIIRLTLIRIAIRCLGLTASAQMETTVGGFTMRFVGVQYDWNAASSTQTYGLTWNDGYSSPNSPSGNNPARSHLTIDLCDDVQPGTVTGITPGFVISFGEGASDPGDWGIVIKWDVIDGTDPITMGEEFLFSFTLPETYAVAPTTFFAKAGGDNNQGLIFGPSCLIADPSIDVEKTCTDDVFVGDSIADEITVTNTGNVALSSVTVSEPPVSPSSKQ